MEKCSLGSGDGRKQVEEKAQAAAFPGAGDGGPGDLASGGGGPWWLIILILGALAGAAALGQRAISRVSSEGDDAGGPGGSGSQSGPRPAP